MLPIFGSGVLDGVAFQRRLETAGVCAGRQGLPRTGAVGQKLSGGSCSRPFAGCHRTQLFLRCAGSGSAQPVPQPINQMLEQGLRRFNRRLPGFADADAVMTGVETRTSSPVRITRDAQSFQALGMQGLYPCGEGAGYAGGIMSAAVDGVRIAQQIIGQYAPLQQ